MIRLVLDNERYELPPLTAVEVASHIVAAIYQRRYFRMYTYGLMMQSMSSILYTYLLQSIPVHMRRLLDVSHVAEILPYTPEVSELDIVISKLCGMYGPGAGLSTCTVRDFCLLRDYSLRLVDDPDVIYDIAAIVWRPAAAPDYRARRPLGRDHSKDIAYRSRRIRRMATTWRRRITPDIDLLLSLSQHYALRVQYLVNGYAPAMFDSEGKSAPGKVDLGWHSIVMSVADGGAHGTVHDVYQLPITTMIEYLIKKRNDHIQMQADIQSQKSKNK